MKLRIAALGALLTTLLLNGSAGAVPLAPGEAAWKTNPAVPETPKYARVLPAYFTDENRVQTLVQPITGDFGGTLRSIVYRNPANNTLAFQYDVTAGGDNPVEIVRMTLAGAGWMVTNFVDVGANAGGSSGSLDPSPEWSDGDPIFISRDDITSTPAIQWRSSDRGAALGRNDRSSLVWIQTDATAWTEDFAGLIDSGSVAISRALVPIPEPATLLLLASGGVLLLARRRAWR